MEKNLGVLIGVIVSYFVASLVLGFSQLVLFSIVWKLVIIGLLWRAGIKVEKRHFVLTFVALMVMAVLLVWVNPRIGLVESFAGLVLTPIMEEMLFRGWIMEQIKGSDRKKIVLSSILFGLYHLKNAMVYSPPTMLYQVFYTMLIVGPVFGWIRLRTRSLLPTMGLHGLNNLLSMGFTAKLIPAIMQRSGKF